MAETYDKEGMLDGAGLRIKLESILPHAKTKINFISAYITQNGIDWFIENSPSNVERRVVCRLLPKDVCAGSTHLSALKRALENGIKVACLHSLHAKIYSIDDRIIYVGSANLTNNGLKIYGSGNLEACIKIESTESNLLFIEKILQTATEIDEKTIHNMQNSIDQKETETYLDKWPEGVLEEEEGIWVQDFFWGDPGLKTANDEQTHDLEIIGISSFDIDEEDLKNHLLQTRCIKWLIGQLQSAPENQLYFGRLTQILHDDIKDDPAPYRKDVKTLLQNLLAYCERYLTEEIEITRPSYSQKIKLIWKS